MKGGDDVSSFCNLQQAAQLLVQSYCKVRRTYQVNTKRRVATRLTNWSFLSDPWDISDR